jgi:hypothetical protein
VSDASFPTMLTRSNQLIVPFAMTNLGWGDLEGLLDYFSQQMNWTRWYQIQRLAATASGRYHFRNANLNDAVRQSDVADFRPVRFAAWLQEVWGPATQ